LSKTDQQKSRLIFDWVDMGICEAWNGMQSRTNSFNALTLRFRWGASCVRRLTGNRETGTGMKSTAWIIGIRNRREIMTKATKRSFLSETWVECQISSSRIKFRSAARWFANLVYIAIQISMT
jgi:hypothetical protein